MYCDGCLRLASSESNCHCLPQVDRLADWPSTFTFISFLHLLALFVTFTFVYMLKYFQVITYKMLTKSEKCHEI